MQGSFFDFEPIDTSQDPKAPNRLQFVPNFITEDEERTLLEKLQKLSWQEVKMHGVIAKRKVVHFGVDYTFDRRTAIPNNNLPDFLQPFIERMAKLMSLPKEKIKGVLVTHYPAGASIGWHKDAPPFGSAVGGISLLSDCTMKFRREVNGQYEIYKLNLPTRSAYVFSGEARWKWEHTIAQHKHERFSITFRTLKSEGSIF